MGVRPSRGPDAPSNALPLFASQVPVGPNALAKREQSLSLLLAGGFDRDLSARVYTAIAHYVVGFTLQQHGSQLSGEDDSMSLRGYFQSLDPRTYPATVAAANELTGVRLQDEFQFGLQLILTERSARGMFVPHDVQACSGKRAEPAGVRRASASMRKADV